MDYLDDNSGIPMRDHIIKIKVRLLIYGIPYFYFLIFSHGDVTYCVEVSSPISTLCDLSRVETHYPHKYVDKASLAQFGCLAYP